MKKDLSVNFFIKTDNGNRKVIAEITDQTLGYIKFIATVNVNEDPKKMPEELTEWLKTSAKQLIDGQITF